MGLFDKFTDPKNEEKLGPSNFQESWLGVLLSVANADGDISDLEVNMLTPSLVRKTIFIGFDAQASIKKMFGLLNGIGSKKLIDLCIPLLPEDHKPTLYANCIEVIVSDGDLSFQEQEIAEYLQKAMGLNPELASKIIEVILIKSKWDSKLVE